MAYIFHKIIISAGCTNTSSMCQMEGNLNTRTCSECSCPLGFGGVVCETNVWKPRHYTLKIVLSSKLHLLVRRFPVFSSNIESFSPYEMFVIVFFNWSSMNCRSYIITGWRRTNPDSHRWMARSRALSDWTCNPRHPRSVCIWFGCHCRTFSSS